MAGMNANSRLEAKDNKIASLKERIKTITLQLREAKAAGKTRRVAGRSSTRAAAAASTDAPVKGTRRARPASPKARGRARARSAQPAAA